MSDLKKPEFMVLSIDGVPHGLIQRMIEQGDMPNLGDLVARNGLKQMRSVQPTVSCVAWASYATGVNPAKHGIYGFIDRREDSWGLSFPNAAMLKSPNLWQILSKAGKRVFGMNVPSSYPPAPVNGVLIGGFLAPTIDKIVYPSDESDYLKSIDYQIDSDAALARQDKKAMLDNLDKTLDIRMEAMFHYLNQENWDFFHTHIMGSDRINHFLWQKMEQNDPDFAPAFFAFYRRIDSYIGNLVERLDDDTPLLIFSDHGFCGIKYEVQLSRYLIEMGWTQPAEKMQHPLSIDPANSRAYCTIPGRIHVNLAGREPGGIVSVEDYQKTRLALADDLMKLRDPDTNDPVIRKVVMREDMYWPSGSQGVCDMTPEECARADGTFGKAADLVAIPYDGYDLKLGLGGDKVFQKTALEGMHTYHDAFMVAQNVELPENLEIMQIARPILEKLGVAVPENMDGAGNAVTPEM